MKTQTKCKCSLKNSITCSNCSKLKMSIMLKNGNKELKLVLPNGKLTNPVWYNHLSKNKKPEQTLINAMYRRFLTKDISEQTNLVIFYNNTTNTELQRIKI